jgi:hypothetical protein
MKSVGEMTIAELAAFVQTHLRQRGIDVVLSGGACVSIYSSNKYVSMDLDLINTHFAKRQEIISAMEELGFEERRRYFQHPDTDLFVEFPAGPLAVGKEPVKEVHERKLATGTLRLISPSDCIKDRLAGYYHWNDLQSLEQAVMVAQTTKIELKEIARWSEVEGKTDEFLRIERRLAWKKI